MGLLVVVEGEKVVLDVEAGPVGVVVVVLKRLVCG